MKFRFLSNNFAESLSKEIAAAVADATGEYNSAVEEVAYGAEAKIREIASTKLHSTRQQYLDGLSVEKMGEGRFVITLDESAAHLDTGYDSFDMKKGLLNSKSLVSTGPNAGKPWVKTSKAGYRYAFVPMEHQQAPAAASHPLHNRPVEITSTREQRRATGAAKEGRTTLGSMASDLKSMLKATGLNRVIPVDNYGSDPVKVGSITPHPQNRNLLIHRDAEGRQNTIDMGRPVDKNLLGLTKYQSKVGNSIKSQYLTFRVVSDNPSAKGKWRHPGYEGVKAFDDIDKWVELELAKRLKDL